MAAKGHGAPPIRRLVVKRTVFASPPTAAGLGSSRSSCRRAKEELCMIETSPSLLNRLRAADPNAHDWAILYDLYRPFIFAWARKASIQDADANDIVQEVFAELRRALPEFEYDRTKGKFRSWLRVVFCNQVRKFRRSRQNRERGIGGIAVRQGSARNRIEGNLISSLLWAILLDSADDNVIQGNFLGTDVSGSIDLGGQLGIAVANGSDNNLIGGDSAEAGNLIAFNFAGVSVSDVNGNSILGNSIHSNGLNIHLSEGANRNQNFPVLESAVSTGTQLTILGTLNSPPNADYRLEFFANATSLGSGRHGETFLGSVNIKTDGAGNATISTVLDVILAGTPYITATATDSEGNTSEFSQVVQASTAPPWHNATMPWDVDGNGNVAPLDVLTLINRINAHPGDDSLPATPAVPPQYYDVNRDERCNATDVILVINRINASLDQAGEGELGNDDRRAPAAEFVPAGEALSTPRRMGSAAASTSPEDNRRLSAVPARADGALSGQWMRSGWPSPKTTPRDVD
jgi:RNA polymerase sigma factor (sigma-70 family)